MKALDFKQLFILATLLAAAAPAWTADAPKAATTTPAKGEIIKPQVDPANPLRPVGEDDPDVVKLNKAAVCTVRMTVKPDGTLGDFSLTASTGYDILDKACLKAFANGRLLPATQNGVPVPFTIEIPIHWMARAAN
jgi:periplasmic protein TonB